MKISQLLVKTLRENPAGAEMPSHIYLLRGGYIKQLASGLYSVLPLGKRILNRIETIIREEMNAISGQEVDLPLAQPCEIWQESGRYDAIGPELLRFKDRSGHDMVLAMTHEEAITDLARSVLSSYKQLPFMIYQFKLKFRDEPRSRGGLIRVREFVMKDAYSFHVSDADLDAYYDQAFAAYQRIFSRMGINPIIVQSDTGIMGGKLAHEFMLESPHGEDYLILSEDGTYSANQEIAVFDRESQSEPPLTLEKKATPGKKTIEEVCNLLGLEKRQTAKAVFFDHAGQLVLVMIRGDLEVAEVKVKNFLHSSILLPASEDFIRKFGIVPGYASSHGVATNANLRVLADISLAEGSNFVIGANEEGYHLLNANLNRDFHVDSVGDFALAQSGHKQVNGTSRLRAVRGIEIGNIFKLGRKFTESMGAGFLDEKGQQQIPTMGCYGIGIGRLMAAVAENSHDAFGPIWPPPLAPFHVLLVTIGMDTEVMEEAESIVKELEAKGYEVLLDDRDERPGVKFKDADLWGIPVRLALSKKTLATQEVEWKVRGEADFSKVSRQEVMARLDSFYSETDKHRK